MATSRTVPGFVPVDSPTYTTPVQITGHVVNNLTVARTPLGQAVFGWSHAGIYYCAVDPDFDDVYRDDVIPDGNEREVYNQLDIAESVSLGSIWQDRGHLYCAVKMVRDLGDSQVLARNLCLIADDVENPVNWSVRGTIDSLYGFGSLQTVNECGPVTVLESGRWILPFPMWGLFGGGTVEDNSGIAYSDDLGLDWTVVIRERLGPIFGGATGPISDTIGQDPNTGNLYWAIYLGAGVGAGIIYESTDDGTTWTAIGGQDFVWSSMIDDGSGKLYAVIPDPTVAWKIWETPDPSDSTTFIDLNLRAIPSAQNDQFQAIVFLEHGSIAFIDSNRIAGYFFGCTIPDPLHIPFKDRLERLQLDGETGLPDPADYQLMAEHDFDNLKTIERWAEAWMTEAQAADRCNLFIPYKDHLLRGAPLPTTSAPLTPASLSTIAALSFDNYKIIERWALCITRGECGCAGPLKCLLHIPFKYSETRLSIDPETFAWDKAALAEAGSNDFDNYKTIERWANDWAMGLCSTGGGVAGSFPPGGFPAPPTSPGRLAGQMLEVATQPPGNACLVGQLLEVATQADGSSRLAGQLLEVAVIL